MARARRTFTDKLPEAFEAHRGWVIDPNTNKAYVLLSEDEFQDQFIAVPLADTYRQVASSIESRLRLQGFQEVNSVLAHQQILRDRPIMTIVENTNMQLVRKGHTSTSVHEYRRFLHHKNIASRFNLSLDLIWVEHMPSIAQRHHFPLMELSRFRALLYNTLGFSIEGRQHKAKRVHIWFQRDDVLKKLRPLEEDIFDSSVQLFLNKKNGVVVIDDGLICSRATDVESKRLSYRKTDKDMYLPNLQYGNWNCK